MNTMYRKAIAYAYPTSAAAEECGYPRSGCYYIARETLREDGTWTPGIPWPGCSAAASRSKSDPHLIEIFNRIDAPVSPWHIPFLENTVTTKGLKP